MSPGDVTRQTPRALLAPFQGAGRFGGVGRADPVVAPPANFWRASGTESGVMPRWFCDDAEWLSWCFFDANGKGLNFGFGADFIVASWFSI